MRSARAAVYVLALGLAGTGAGCFLVPNPAPESAEVRLEGAAGAEVTLVAATAFNATRFADSLVVGAVSEADTLLPELPFAEEYDISQFERFFVRVTRMDPAADSLRLRVLIDGDTEYDEEGAVSDSLLEFVYIFRGEGGAPGDVF